MSKYKFKLIFKDSKEKLFDYTSDAPLPVPRIGEVILLVDRAHTVKSVQYQFESQSSNKDTEIVVMIATVILV